MYFKDSIDKYMELYLVHRVDTISRYEISHQEFISYFRLFREISRPSFEKLREIKMEIVSEISWN